MHYPDSRWRPRCQGKSRDDVSGRIQLAGLQIEYHANVRFPLRRSNSVFLQL